MASEIGYVKSIEGAVKVIGADGIEKVVVAGEVIFENDVVITGAAGSAVLTFEDGHTIEVGADEHLSLDSSVSTEATADDAVVGDVAALQAALLAGEELEPTAAGISGGGGGSSGLSDGAVYDQRTDDRGDVQAGQTPDAWARDFPEAEINTLLEPEPEPVIPEPVIPAPPPPPPPPEPVITVESVTSAEETEGTVDNDLIHTVTMSGESVNDETYSFSLADNTTEAEDHGEPTFSNGVTYDPDTGLITVPAGVTSFTVTTTVTDDALEDSGEFYDLNVGGVDATGTILDETDPFNPPTPPDDGNELDPGTEISISGATETDEGDAVTYTVSVTNAPLVDMDVEITTSNITTNGDVVVGTQTVTILANTNEIEFTIDNVEDAIKENPEDYKVEITDYETGGYEAVAEGVTSVTTTITDDDEVTVESVTSAEETEGTVDNDLIHTVTMSGESVNDEIYSFSLADNTTEAEDHGEPTFSNGVTLNVAGDEITVPAGVTSFTVTTTVTDDALEDSGEFYDLNVGGVDATGTILDETDPFNPPTPPDDGNELDPGTEISISGATETDEGDAVTYTVSVTNAPLVDMDVEITTSNITTNGDVVVGTQTVTILANTNEIEFTIDNVEDAIKENPEDYKVEITDYETGGYEAVAEGVTSVTTTITDDDEVTVESVTSAEETEGTVDNDLIHTVTMSGESVNDETYSFSLADNTTEAEDHGEPTFSNGVTLNVAGDEITVPAGVTSFTVTTTVTDDALEDSGEFYDLNVGGVDATGTILDETDPFNPPTPPDDGNELDPGTEISISGATETDEGDAVTYTVSVTNAPLVDMDVEITTSNITTNGDVVVGTQTVTILANTNEIEFTIDNVEDAIKENPEDYKVEITDYETGGYEAVAEGVTSVTTTITDDDEVTVESVTSAEETEGTVDNDLIHTVTMSGESVNDETYSFSLADNTTEAEDHGEPTFSNGVTLNVAGDEITVPAGVTSFTVTTTVTDDALEDSGEFYDLNVGGVDATGTILDETDPFNPPTPPDDGNELDPGTEISISGATETDEGDAVTYTVSVTNAPLVDMDVEITTSNITTNGDVVVGTQTVTILANTNEIEFTIDNVEDAIKENPEDYKVEITDYETGGYEAVAEGDMNVVTTITDDDEVTVESVTSDEQEEGTDLVHNVVMSGASPNDETYTFTLTNDTTEDNDYTAPTDLSFSNGVTYDAVNDEITVPFGVTGFSITIPTTIDADVEDSEVYDLVVGDVSTATGTILDGPHVVTYSHPDLEGADNTVLEEGLTSDDDDSETTSPPPPESFTVSAGAGIDTLTISDANGDTVITYAQLDDLSTDPIVIDTGEGLLTLTGYIGGETGGTVTYSYTVTSEIDNDSAGTTGDDSVTDVDFNDSVTLTIKSDNGTEASDNLVITIVDDEPDLIETGETGEVQNIVMSVDADAATASLGIDVGADNDTTGGATTDPYVTFAGAIDETTGIAALLDGEPVTGTGADGVDYTLKSDGNDLEYRVDADGSVDGGYEAIPGDPTSFVTVFTLTGNAVDGSYTMETDPVHTIDSTYDIIYNLGDAVPGNVDSQVIIVGDIQLTITGDGGTVNTSGSGSGIGDQSIESGEDLFLTFEYIILNEDGTAKLDGDGNTIIDTSKTVDLEAFSFIADQLDGGSLNKDGSVKVDPETGTYTLIDGATVDEFGDTYYDETTDIVAEGTFDGIPGKGSTSSSDEEILIEPSDDGTGVTVSNTDGEFIIGDSGLTEDESFNSIKLSVENGDSYRISGGDSVKITLDSPDVTLNLSATIVDSDGDESDPQEFDITFATGDTLTGSDEPDVIVASDAGQELIGGDGNDVLFGGEGVDTFDGVEEVDTFDGDVIEDEFGSFDTVIDPDIGT